MARALEIVIVPSVLDRLIDEQAQMQKNLLLAETKGAEEVERLKREAAVTRKNTERRYKDAVRRDLEWLLNTRRVVDSHVEEYPHLKQSVYCYGLPDLSSLGVQSTPDQDLLLNTIEQTLETFEPRLDQVRVSLDPVSSGSRVLRFRIEGVLLMDPAPVEISFDTMLDPSNGGYEVS